MTFIRISILCFIVMSLSWKTQAQSTRKAKGLHRKTMRKAAPEERKFLKKCRKVLVNYSWTAIKPLMDEENFDYQIDLYLNDDFMFNHLGPAGQRDSSKVYNYYIRESLGLSQAAEEKHISGFSDLQNFFKLEDLTSIAKVYFVKSELIASEIKAFYFIALTKDKKVRYFGKIWLRDGLDGFRIYGTVG